MKCNFTGYPYPQVRWLKNGNLVGDSGPYKILTEDGIALLSIEKPGLQDNAVFTCEAANAVGVARTHCFLNVEGTLSFIELQKSLILFLEEGTLDSHIRLDVFCNKELLDTTIDITVVETEVAAQIYPRLRGRMASTDTDDSQITLTAPDDETPTTSEFEEELDDGKVRKPYRQKPSFSRQLESRTVAPGESLRLKTLVAGMPVPQVSWHFDKPETIAGKSYVLFVFVYLYFILLFQ